MQAQADAFRAQNPGEDVDPSWNLLSGMKLPKSFKTNYDHPQAPVFTHMIENKFPNLYEEPLFAIYLNTALPYLDAYPGNEGRAAMSFVHLLVVPKERIYNVATLRKSDDYLLASMYYTTRNLFTRPDFISKLEMAILEHHFYAPENQTFDSTRRESLVNALKALRNMTGDDLSFWFHEHPNHSVGHLHMHVLLNTALTDAFEIHKHKNVSYNKVMTRLEN